MDNIIDQDTPDVSLKIEFVQTDTFILPFTKPGTASFVVAPVLFIVEDLTKDSTVMKLTSGNGLEILGDTITMTIPGPDLKCFVGRKLFGVMTLINEGKRDIIMEIKIKYAPE